MTGTLAELLHRAEAAVGEATFAAGRSGEWTGDGFGALARRIAAGLRVAGVRPGDRVAAFLEHDVELAAFPFACALAGAVSVVVNPRLRDAQVRHIVEDAAAALVLTSAIKGVGLTDPAAAFGDRAVLVDADEVPAWAGRLPGGDVGAAPVDVDPDTAATILYTSGSTGLPKGIVQSHRALTDGARIVAGYLGLGPADHVLAVLPLSFDYGLNQVLGAAWAGCRVSLLQYLFAGEVVRALRDRECTVLAGVPEVWVDIVSALERVRVDDLRALRCATNSGGRLPERVLRFFAESMPWVEVFSMYGLTEAFRSSFVPPSELAARPRSIGKAMPEVELMVVDPATGAVVGPGEVGELVHCGACVALGYWRRPEETAARFRPHPVKGAAGGTCVRTGDLARADGDGFLELVGRSDAQIKVGGYRVSPDEVVDVVREVAGVRTAAAVGVPRGPDGIPALCVAVEAAADAAVLPDAVRAACADRLPSWMVPAEVRVVAALPRNPNQKVDLAAVRALFLEAGA